MKNSSPRIIELIVVGYCLWQSLGIWMSWFDSPFLRWGWVAFFFWILPVLVYWSFSSVRDKSTNMYFLVFGLFLSILGSLGELNALKHIGLAFAIGGLLPFSSKMWVWLATSITWMPSAAYFSKSLPIEYVIGIRLIMAFFGMGWGLLYVYQKLRSNR